jgi:hypothetical protein
MDCRLKQKHLRGLFDFVSNHIKQFKGFLRNETLSTFLPAPEKIDWSDLDYRLRCAGFQIRSSS